MFNKEESMKDRKVKLNSKSVSKRIKHLLLTTSFLVMLGSTVDTRAADIISCGSERIKYFERRDEYYMTHKYDQKIVDLYDSGTIIIDGNVYSLDNFYIKFNTKKEDFDLHLICIGSGYTDILTKSTEKYEHNGVAKFIDTTAFIELIESECVLINDNCITVLDKESFLNMIKNWDGKLHDKTSDTEAISNKVKMER